MTPSALISSRVIIPCVQSLVSCDLMLAKGRHWLEMHFCDPDMRPVLKPIRQDFEIRIPSQRSQTHIHIWQHLGFHLERSGDYYFELKVDGDIKSRIPLYVVQAQRP